MSDDTKLDAASFNKRLNDKREQAVERLKEQRLNAWYFPVMGIWTELTEYEFPEKVRFQRVFDQPGEIELAGALKEAGAFGAVGRYSRSINYEFAVESDGRDRQMCF